MVRKAEKRGGEIVCEGTPEKVSECARSITGRYLGERLEEAVGHCSASASTVFSEAAEPQVSRSVLEALPSADDGEASRSAADPKAVPPHAHAGLAEIRYTRSARAQSARSMKSGFRAAK